MNVVTKENVRPFDCDGCLIRELKHSELQADAYVKDPLTMKNIGVKVNKAMVRLLKEEHYRGGYVVVWSRSGWEWAKNIVEALELQEYVHQVMSKPIAYFDDKDVSEWLKDRVFLDFDVKYKE